MAVLVTSVLLYFCTCTSLVLLCNWPMYHISNNCSASCTSSVFSYRWLWLGYLQVQVRLFTLFGSCPEILISVYFERDLFCVGLPYRSHNQDVELSLRFLVCVVLSAIFIRGLAPVFLKQALTGLISVLLWPMVFILVTRISVIFCCFQSYWGLAWGDHPVQDGL